MYGQLILEEILSIETKLAVLRNCGLLYTLS